MMMTLMKIKQLSSKKQKKTMMKLCERHSMCSVLDLRFAWYVLQLLNTQTHAHVRNLVPSVEYKLSVEIRPMPSGFWSDATWLRITTLPDGLFLSVLHFLVLND